MSTVHENLCIFMIISRWILLTLRHCWDKFVEKIKTHILFFFTFCWPCIAVYLSQYLTNLMHKICFTISFISCLYMFRAYVLIIKRSKLHYTASGIITPIGVKQILCIKLVKYWDKHILCSITFSANRAFNEIIWKNMAELCRP